MFGITLGAVVSGMRACEVSAVWSRWVPLPLSCLLAPCPGLLVSEPLVPPWPNIPCPNSETRDGASDSVLKWNSNRVSLLCKRQQSGWGLLVSELEMLEIRKESDFSKIQQSSK